MEKEMNIQEPLHRDCAPHDAAHCDINDHHNNAKNGFDAEAILCSPALELEFRKVQAIRLMELLELDLLQPALRGIKIKIRSTGLVQNNANILRSEMVPDTLRVEYLR